MLVNVQVTSSPASMVTVPPDADRGAQVNEVSWYPEGPLSASWYCPGSTCTLVTARAIPGTGHASIGPVADSVQSSGVADPPSTVLRRVR